MDARQLLDDWTITQDIKLQNMKKHNLPVIEHKLPVLGKGKNGNDIMIIY